MSIHQRFSCESFVYSAVNFLPQRVQRNTKPPQKSTAHKENAALLPFGCTFRKISLILGTILGILAASGVVFAQGEENEYVLKSLNMLRAVQTVECDIRIETFVNGKEYSARGRYEEQALPRTDSSSFLRSMYRLDIYFSMNLPMASGAEPNRMTLVCRPSGGGGRGLVERRTSIEGVESFSTVDLTQLKERLKESGRETVFAQVSEIRNLGGLAGMMEQVCRFYEFSAHSQENLQNEEMIPALKLTGTLRKVYYKELLMRFGGLKQGGLYPADFPGDIEIWLGRHNDFPYKIRYLRRISEKSDQKVLLFQESFYRVVLNGTPIPDSRFVPLNPPEDVFPLDDTENLIKSLGL